MAIELKTVTEIAKLREANLVVADVLDVLEAAAKPGMSTWELNEVASNRLKQLKADSAFLGYHGYPAVLCTSVNDVVVHGIPRRDVVLKDGDLLSIDFGAFKDGWCGDSARTLPIGKVSDEAAALVKATKESLERAITQCIPGNRLGDIGWAVQSHVEPKGYSVVRQFVGHGIGRAMHEEPHVPNYGKAGNGRRLSVGLVVAIEPMVNAGSPDVVIKDDGWTAVTKDGSLSAHFEHSVAITDDGPVVLSRA
ncbi:MAG TPA: type I methionyl aminopeptidase [Polyangia bacterium]|jgi:methionyl aminopeptidase|nr:type I methionyl aminopeptidase [Polyangia bacterium]